MKFLLPLCLIAALLAGCAGAPAYKLTEQDRMKYANITPAELVAKVQARFKKAEADELALYAPVSFRNAKFAVEDAAKALEKRATTEEILSFVGGADNQLDTGYRNKEKSRELLAANYVLDKRLQELHAPQAAAADYRSQLSRFSNIYELVDLGDMAKAEKERIALTEDQKALKLTRTKAEALEELKKIHAQLANEKAEGFVPAAVKEATDAHQAAVLFIENHVDDAKAIKATVHDAMVLALRAQWMAVRAKHLRELDTSSAKLEQIVVEEEQWFATVSAGVGGDPLRHLSPDEQAAELAKRARELNAAVAASNNQKSDAAKSAAVVTQPATVEATSTASAEASANDAPLPEVNAPVVETTSSEGTVESLPAVQHSAELATDKPATP